MRIWSNPFLAILAVGACTGACGDVAHDGGSGGTGATGTGGTATGGTSTGGTATGGTGTGGTGTGGTGTGGTAATGGGSSGPVICAGVPCAAGEDCCMVDGTCFDPVAEPGACAPPTDPGTPGQTPCTASSQCAADEFCAPANTSLCLGPGFCQSKSNCGTSSGKEMCGCNGKTYPNVQTACAEGVAIIGTGACGETQTVGAAGGSAGKTVTYCATSDMCPAGEECCSITGQCYDPSEPVLCSFPPEGTSVPCVDDSQCFEGFEYCKKDGCDGPGGCIGAPGPGACTGELTPVCGCNGKSYTNAGCAAVDGTNVDHVGECTP